MSEKPNNRRVSKAEWLATGLDALEEGGVDAVRVERLAKQLGISRSGFYWHFKDRKDLHRDILAYWRNEFTDVVIRNVGAMGGSPEDRLVALTEMIAKYKLTRHELAIREWAKHDPEARAAVAEVNKVRLDFVRSLFSEMGFKDDELEMRTMLFVCYQSWEAPMFFDMPASKLNKLRKFRLRLLTRK